MKKRRTLVEANVEPSMRRQCELSRSSLYYEAVGPDAEERELMKRLEELHLKHPFYGSRKLGQALKAATVDGESETSSASDGSREHGPETEHEQGRARAPELPVFAEESANRTSETSLGARHHVHSDGAGFRVPGGDHRLVLAARARVTVVEHVGRFCVEALEEEFWRYGSSEIFNTDQGSQFMSEEFTEPPLARGVQVGMDSKGRWRDIVFIERLWRSLKYEEVYLHAYGSLMAARVGIANYLDFFNDERPQDALGGQTPARFYAGSIQEAA